MIEFFRKIFLRFMKKTVSVIEPEREEVVPLVVESIEEEVGEDEVLRIKEKILTFFRNGKISSIRVDDSLVYDYKKIPYDVTDRDIRINKKFISLFDKEDQRVVFESFVDGSEDIVLRGDGSYMKVIITHHARLRFMSRCLIMSTFLRQYDSVENFLIHHGDRIVTKFKNYIRHQNKDIDSKKIIFNFCKDYGKDIDKEIRKSFHGVKLMKNPPAILKKRLARRSSKCAYYHDKVFMWVYDIKTSNVVTVELGKFDKKGSVPGDIVVDINGDTLKYQDIAFERIRKLCSEK